MRAMRIVPILVLAFGLTGCGFVIETIAGNVFAGTPKSDIDGSGMSSASIARVVADKVPPRTLVARDGSLCEVPRARFDYIRIGQSIVCVWVAANLSSPIRRHY